MNTLWVLATSLAVASAEVGLGYQYKAPQSSYGVPSYQFGENAGVAQSSALNGNVGSTISPISSDFLSQSGQSSGSGLYNSDLYGLSNGQYYPSIGSGIGSTENGQYYQSSLGGEPGLASTVGPLNPLGGDISQTLPSFGQYPNAYQNAAAYKYQQNYIQQQPAQIFKHFYIHSAPEEPITPRQPIVLPPPQRHYKIIFVKTPAQEAPAPQVVAVPQLHEEKTIVYVLSKKPEEQPPVILPNIGQRPPSKPEVFYVKYMNRENPQAVISNIVNNLNSGQQQVPFSGISNGAQGGYDASSPSPFGSEPQLLGSGSPGIIDSGISSSAAPGQIAETFSDAPVEVNIPAAGFGSNSLGATQGSSGVQSIEFASPDSSILSIGSSLPPASASESSTSSTGLTDGLSSTASSVSYDNPNLIPTSQGVPHETYGPPKFRVNK